jgi:hypothetical protein
MNRTIVSASRLLLAGLLTGLVASSGMVLSGCQALAVIEAQRRRDSTRTVEALYRGLENKSFAVVVAADRTIQGDHPQLVDELVRRVTQRLSQSTNQPRAKGFVAPQQVLTYLYNNPGWQARPMSQIARDLGGVERVIFIDVYEFRLHDPGNAYLWEGQASATVSVVETDSVTPDAFAYQRSVSVPFPDQRGVSRQDVPEELVASALLSRLVDRASWIFYTHEEPYEAKY